jgi:nitrogen-specific signal transduction histidine kinase
MDALAAMTDHVAHEVGNPLVMIAGVAEQLPPAPLPPAADGGPAPQPARLILEQTDRIARMMRQMTDFAAARGATREWVDVNAMVKAVCDFRAFDRRLRGAPSCFEPAEHMPARELVPDQVNEVLMARVQASTERAAHGTPPQPVVVRTRLRRDDAMVRLEGTGMADAQGNLAEDPACATIPRLAKAAGARLSGVPGGLQGGVPGGVEMLMPPPRG